MTDPPQRDDMLAETIRIAERLLGDGEHKAVVAHCTAALRERGERPELRVFRARGLLAMRRLDEAERDLALALRLRPESATIHRLLCEAALCRGDLAAAEIFLDRALDLDPSHPRARELAQVALGWRAECTALRYGAGRAA